MENYKAKLPHYLKMDAEGKKEEIKQAIADYKACIEILENIKRTHKKDGADFQNLWKNFETPENVRIGRRVCVFSKYATIHGYLNGNHEIQLDYHTVEQNPTADEIEAEIKKHIEIYKGRLANAENDLKKFDDEVEQLANLTEKVGEFLDWLESKNDYKLRELLKKVL